MRRTQRTDGHWDAVAGEPASGLETSTATFMATGFARGVAHGLLDEATFGPAIAAAWAAAEFRRNDVANVLEAGRALARYDARPWAGSLGVPAGLLLTTRDRLVPPAKQRALAEALRAEVVELRDDHLCTITSPTEYAAATVQLVQHVLRAG